MIASYTSLIKIIVFFATVVFCILANITWSDTCTLLSALGAFIFSILIFLTNDNFLVSCIKVVFFLIVFSLLHGNFLVEICMPLLFILILLIICDCLRYDFHVQKVDTPYTETEKRYIVNLNDVETITGEITGGWYSIHGTLEGKYIYTFYYILPNGDKKLDSVDADKATIHYESDDITPYIETIIETYYSLDYNVSPPVRCRETQSKSYVFHIPNNSINNDIELDAK